MSDLEILDTTIPEVREQLLRCAFGCEMAKDLDAVPGSHCSPVCKYAETIELEYRKVHPNETQ